MSLAANSNVPKTTEAPAASGEDSLSARVAALEHALAAEKARRQIDSERETRERQRQFSLLLEEMSKAVEKMERRDIELERGLRAELTRQNRFIYEEFQARVGRLTTSLEEESTAIRGDKMDRAEARSLVLSLLGEGTPREFTVETLLR